MRLSSLALALLTGTTLTWACKSSAVREELNAAGEEVRLEQPELDAEGVSADEVAARMARYRDQVTAQGVLEQVMAANPDDEATRPVEEEEDAGIDAVLTAAELQTCMEAYLNLPADSRSVTATGDILSESVPGTPAFDPFEERGCPPEGSAKKTQTKKLNKLKNRVRKPHASDFDDEVTLKALRAPGDDAKRWSTATAVTIEVYCKKITATGAETCNCGATQSALTDTHFDMTSGPNDKGKPVIAEVTPVWRLIHEHFKKEDWSSSALKKKYQGKKVRITGWLFFDEMHLHEADNTDPTDAEGKKNWRATCWELHPITNIELIN